MGILYDIIEGLNVMESGRMEFSSDKEASDFCKRNGLSTSCIEYDSNGDVYIDDVDVKIESENMRKTLSTHGQSSPIRYTKRSNNHSSYKGLERYNDDQINLLKINNAIIKNPDGTYKADWSRVKGKWR